MAYNKNNYHKTIRLIIEVYNQVKQRDIPDTFIIRHIFPKHQIYLSYRKWMYIKGAKLPVKQPTLFD